MQRTMLAAVHVTEERLIAPRYMIQISTHLAFSFTKRELFALVAICWMNLRMNLIGIYFLAHKNTTTERCSLRDDFSGNVAVFNVYNVTVTSSSYNS